MEEKPKTVYQRTLERAADILGGKEMLRVRLRVPMSRLEAWLAGERPPIDIFLRAVDLVSPPRPATVLERSAYLRQTSADVLQRAERVREEAARARDASAAARRVRAAHEFFSRSFELADRREVVEAALEAALDVTGTDMGNVQLASTDGLRIVAQQGFKSAFLEYFAVVSDASSACGRALQSGQRVVVSDVVSHEIFAGTQAGEVMQAAGARACQSTPMVAASGWVLGVISTHSSTPGAPNEEALARVDLIARRAAAWLEDATALGR